MRAFGGARVLHSLTFSVALLGVLMLATPGRKPIRKMLLGLPIGTLLYLVFTRRVDEHEVFWWPFGGSRFRRCSASGGRTRAGGTCRWN